MVSEKLIAGMRHLGFKPVIDEQDSRIWIQKVAYLLKVCDFGLDFAFFPYKMGPYSYGLKDDYFANRQRYERLETSYELTELDKAILDKIRGSVDLNSIQRLEGAASAAMMILTNQTWDDRELMKLLWGWKQRRLTEEQIMIAIDDAKRILFRDEFVTPKIREELQAWEELSAEAVSRFNIESTSPIS